jgi:TonB-dependent starch-binding outer membrane protein SusC
MFKTQFSVSRFLGLLSLLLLCSGALFSQAGPTVRGKVTDDRDSAIANVSIVVKGTTNGTTTDQDGNFSLSVPSATSVLVLSGVGYTTQEIALANRTSITARLVTSSSDLQNVIVVGYGTQKKVTVTGAVATVKGTELQKSPTVNLSNALAGRLPGITAIQSGGEPGYDGSTIRIR